MNVKKVNCHPFEMNVWFCFISKNDNFVKYSWLFFYRPHGDPQMLRFGAHLVLVLRYLLTDDMKDPFKEELMIIGDRIINM